MLELVLWGSVQLIEVFAIIKIYKKITNKVKSRFYFTFLCIGILIPLPLLILNFETIFVLLRYILYYSGILIQPLFSIGIFTKKKNYLLPLLYFYPFSFT